jgi:5-methylcytosine-specific restriction protein A
MDSQRTRGKRLRRPYSGTEQRRRAEAVAAHRAQSGDWCPGWGVSAHGSRDLTADHVVPVAMGGAEAGDLAVLCRSCNGRKAARGIG